MSESISVGNNVDLYYDDSGPVAGGSYTTLVCVHGMGFRGSVFRPLFPIAAEHGFRIVALYRRGYPPPGKTDSNSDDAFQFGDAVDRQREILSTQGQQFATFLERFISKSGIPPAQNGNGGIAVLGWSLGTLAVAAWLGNLDKVPSETLATLDKYVHTVILQEASTTVFGFVNPGPEIYDISLWSETDSVKRVNLFKDWCAAYYDHVDSNSGDITKIEFNKYSDEFKPSFSDAPTDELNKTITDEGFNYDIPSLFLHPEVSKEMTQRALFNKEWAEKYLPHLRVRCTYGGQTSGILVWCNWQLQKAIDDPAGTFGGEKARDLRVTSTEKGNHLVFVDTPVEALAHYQSLIDN